MNPDLLTKTDVANMLQINVRTVDAWRKSGKLPYIKLGTDKNSPVRFRRDAVQAFIDAGISE